MKCRRCAASFSIMAGRLTGGGMICPRCQAIDDIAARHGAAARAVAEGPAAGAAALAADAAAEAAFREHALRWRDESAALAVERLLLGRGDAEGLAALDAAMGWPADRPARREALAALLAETLDPAHLRRLAALDADAAAAALGTVTPPADLPEAWVEALRDLAGRGFSGAAADALARAGARALPRVIDLAAALARAGAGDGVVAWAASARLVGGPGDLAPLLRAVADLPHVAAPLRDTVLRRCDEAEAIDLLLSTGDAEAAAERLRAAAAPSVALLALLRRRPADLPADDVAAALRRWLDRPGAAAGPIFECARAIASDAAAAPVLLDAAAAAAEAAGAPAEALALLRRAAAAAPSPERARALEGFRPRCLERLRAAEADGARRLRAALDLLLAGDFAGARKVLEALTAPPWGPRTLAGRSAAFVRAGLEAVDLEIVASYGGALRRASQARKAGGGAPLSDQGATEAEASAAARRFAAAVEALLALDAPPFPRLVLPLPPAPPSRASDRAAEGARRERLEALALPRDPTRDEASFLLPVRRFHAANLLAVFCAGGEEPAWGSEAPLERASAYGLIGRRAAAPMGDDDAAAPPPAPRATAEALLVRALAFAPGAPGSFSFDRWSRFRASFMDALQVLGRDPADVVPAAEVWAAWDVHAPEAPRDPHLPGIDAPPAMDFLRPSAPAPARDSSRLDAGAALRDFKI